MNYRYHHDDPGSCVKPVDAAIKLTFAEKHPAITSVGVGAAANQVSHEMKGK